MNFIDYCTNITIDIMQSDRESEFSIFSCWWLTVNQFGLMYLKMNFFVTDCMCIMLLLWIEKEKYGKRHLYVYCLVIEIAMGCWNEQTKFLLLSWNLYMYKINYWKMLLFSDTFYLVMDFEYSFCIWHTQEWKVVSTFSFMYCCICLLEKHNRVLIYTKNVYESCL